MSGLSFSDRVKLLLQKRLDAPKWPVGDSPPGAIRYLSDGQGNMIAMLTTSVNPNDTEPIGPGSAEAAATADPTFKAFGNINYPATFTKRVNTQVIVLNALITTTNDIATFHQELADFTVPSTKKLEMLKMVLNGSVASVGIGIGHGSDGVADGVTDPTDPIRIIGEGETANINHFSGYVTSPTASLTVEHDIYALIPASRLPFLEKNDQASEVNATVYCLESDT